MNGIASRTQDLHLLERAGGNCKLRTAHSQRGAWRHHFEIIGQPHLVNFEISATMFHCRSCSQSVAILHDRWQLEQCSSINQRRGVSTNAHRCMRTQTRANFHTRRDNIIYFGVLPRTGFIGTPLHLAGNINEDRTQRVARGRFRSGWIDCCVCGSCRRGHGCILSQRSRPHRPRAHRGKQQRRDAYETHAGKLLWQHPGRTDSGIVR